MSKRDEFDTVAAWTVEAVEALGIDDPVPAACNGSGNPAWLAWLADQLRIGPGQVVVDTGGGLGGPAAWLGRHTGAEVIVAEPMVSAVRGARRLFGLGGVASWSHQLPLAGGRVDAALALAVLSAVEDKPLFLAEVRRILGPGGGLGLIEYVATGPGVGAGPEGNEFLRRDELVDLLASSGFEVHSSATADELPPAPEAWDDTDRRVTGEIERTHGDRPAWQETATQRRRFGDLLGADRLGVVLVHARLGRPGALP